MSEVLGYRLAVARRRRDGWALGPALTLPEAAYGGPVYDLVAPDPVLAWVTFPDRSLEVEARVTAHGAGSARRVGVQPGSRERLGVARRRPISVTNSSTGPCGVRAWHALIAPRIVKLNVWISPRYMWITCAQTVHEGVGGVEMTDVLTVASYIEEKLQLPRYDTKKLQKLVYFAQAWSLAWTGKKMFDDAFEAWPDGPVVRELFRVQKHYDLPKYDGTLPLQDQEIIDSVLSYYGGLGHQDLINLTHDHSPWLEARGGLPATTPSRKHLRDESLRDFYTQRAICDTDGPTRQTTLLALTDASADEIGDVVGAEWEETLTLLAKA